MTDRIKKYWLKTKMRFFVVCLVAASSIVSWAGTYCIMSAEVAAAKADAEASEQWAVAVENQATEILEKLEAKICQLESRDCQ